MKKVLIVIPSLEQGGGQKFVVDLMSRINKQEFIVKMLVYYAPSGSIFDQYVERKELDVIYLNKKPGMDIALIKRVGKEIKDFKPDVIHSHLHSMLYLLPYYRKYHLKFHTVHTLAEKEAKGMQGLIRFISYKLIGVVPVGISDTVAESISKKHRIKLSKIPIVYNGVDCNRYNLPHRQSSVTHLITVGTIYHVKNYAFLIDCFGAICKEVDNIHLTIVGDGVLRNEIELQIARLNINDRVTITGVIDNVENYLSSADIYVASSIYEGLPLSMLEAMSAGLPVVSTDVGGVHDIIKSGENGILVQPGDRERYISALKELIQNERERLEMSENARKMSKKFDEQITVEGYEKLYRGK